MRTGCAAAGQDERSGPCVMCAGADASVRSPLQRMLPPGRSRFIAQTPNLVAVPTFGCFVAGYVLIVPRAHVTSFGRLDEGALAEADELIEALAHRIWAVYSRPALGFEYGNNVPGGRRIEHAHWHLLPSGADLDGWLADCLTGLVIASLTDLPSRGDASYIAVRDQRGSLRVYPVPNQPRQRIRLRRLVAELDPRVDAAGWDWTGNICPDLIRRTVTDLAPASPEDGTR